MRDRLFPSSVLVIIVSRIGDTLFATPAMRAMATAWPRARLTAAAHPKRAEVLRHLPWLHEVRVITKNRGRWQGWLGRPRYDLAFVYGFDAPLVRYALRVANRVVAFRQGDEELDARLYRAVEVPAFQSEHAVRQLLRLPAAVGVEPVGLRLSYRVTPEESERARERLYRAGLATATPLVGLQVASFPTKAYRDWPIEHFEALCQRIRARWPDAGFLLYGGTRDVGRTAWLEERLGGRAANFAGRLTLRETAALMSLTDLYIGVDTGPTHIMSTFDIPLVALYHCLSPSTLTGPLEHPCAYSIDHPTGCDRCGEATPMADITVAGVFDRVVRALADHPPRPR